MKLLVLQFFPVSCYFLPPSIYFSVLFLNMLSLCCVLTVSDQVSHPFATAGTLSQTEHLNPSRIWKPKYQSYSYINCIYVNFRLNNQFSGKCVLKVWAF
jgi:hypothetical protein